MRALIRLTKLPRVPFQPTETKSATSMCLKPTRQTSNWSMKNQPAQKHILNTLKTSQDLTSLGVAPRPRSKAIGLGSFRRNEMNDILVGDTFHWMQLECKIDMLHIRQRQFIKFLHDTSEQKNGLVFRVSEFSPPNTKLDSAQVRSELVSSPNTQGVSFAFNK